MTGTDENGWTRSQIDLIKATVAKDTTDEELQLFLMIARRTGLDPFARQIYCIRRYDKAMQRKVATIQTSIDGYRLLADRTGRYAPGRETTYATAPNGQIVSATAYVKKFIQNGWHEIAATAYFEEYAQESPLWKRMPRVMLAKCAESLALRRAFPAELSGIYTSDEMGATDAPLETPPAVIDVEPETPRRLSIAGHGNATVEPFNIDPSEEEASAFAELGEQIDDATNKRASLEAEIMSLVAETPKVRNPQAAIEKWILAKYDVPEGLNGLFLSFVSDAPDTETAHAAFIEELEAIRDHFKEQLAKMAAK